MEGELEIKLITKGDSMLKVNPIMKESDGKEKKRL